MHLKLVIIYLILLIVMFHNNHILSAQENDDNGQVCSASLSNWRTAIKIILTSNNRFMIKRAERSLNDTIIKLPGAERAEAYQFLDELICRGFKRNAKVSCIFDEHEKEKRIILFEHLKTVSWASWDGASLEQLFQKIIRSPKLYNSKALVHNDFIEYCRDYKKQVTPDLLGQILLKYSHGDFFNGLRLAHGVHDDQRNRWRSTFEDEYGDMASVQLLWMGFEYLNMDLWDSLKSIRTEYQQHLGDKLFNKKPLNDWLKLEPEKTLKLARISSKSLIEWEYKLAKVLKNNQNNLGLSLLYYFCHADKLNRETYDKLSPLFFNK